MARTKSGSKKIQSDSFAKKAKLIATDEDGNDLSDIERVESDVEDEEIQYESSNNNKSKKRVRKVVSKKSDPKLLEEFYHFPFNSIAYSEWVM